MPQSPSWVIIRFLVDNLPLILILMIWGFMLYTVHSHIITQTRELQIWLRRPQLEQSDLFPLNIQPQLKAKTFSLSLTFNTTNCHWREATSSNENEGMLM